MQRIVVLNPKGGSGKTTIASNLAACHAIHGERPALMDLDPQGSSMRWLRKRPDDAPAIYGIAAFERSATVTRSWQMRIPADCRTVVIDTPAAIDAHALPELTRSVDAVLVPVMPSEIDIHATAKCIADLLLVAKIRRSENRIGIIANRVRINTRMSHSLTRFLDSLDIPLIATLRDTQNYLRSAENRSGRLRDAALAGAAGSRAVATDTRVAGSKTPHRHYERGRADGGGCNRSIELGG
jgi:chromosome partitioning protein